MAQLKRRLWYGSSLVLFFSADPCHSVYFHGLCNGSGTTPELLVILYSLVPPPDDFMPHGYCYMWNPVLVKLNVVSDSLIALAYVTISFGLLWFVSKRRDFSFSSIFLLFGAFIIACASTHAMEVWNLWHSQYWLAGALKSVTAFVSILTAVYFLKLLPTAVELPGAEQWAAANLTLRNEIQERRELEVTLRGAAARFRQQSELIELIHDAIFVRDINNEIVFWNRGAERLYGWRREEAQGRISHELLHTEFSCDRLSIEAAVREKGYWEGELNHQTRAGVTVPVSSRWALHTGAGGEFLGILESNRDLTKLKYEERRFRNLLEAGPDAVVIVDDAGVIQIVNARTEDLFGYSRNELIGDSIAVLLPHSVPMIRRHFSEPRSRSSQPYTVGTGLDLSARRKNGTEFPVEITLSPIETEQGTLISSSIRDVSARRRLERELTDANEFLEQRVAARTLDLATTNTELRKSKELLGMTNDVARIGTFDLDSTADRANWSPVMEQIYGLAPAQFDGRMATWRSLVHPDDLAQFELGSAKTDETGVALHIEFRIVQPDRQVRWVASRAKRFANAEGQMVRVVGVNLDITDQRNREQEISAVNATLERRVAERTAELVRSNSELESFSYSVSHDLRAPLRHVDGFARILKEDHSAELSEEGARYLDRIIRAATQMGHLIDDLLNLARIGRKELIRQTVSLENLVRQTLADLHPESARAIEWRVESLPERSCDPGLIKLVFTNLLSNAAKFTRACPFPIVEVGSCDIDGVLTIFVRDNGVGFDPRYADKLFGVFQRLHRQEDFEGTGIGLATVQRIIQRHGGRVWAKSSPGCGATFFFTLEPSLPKEDGRVNSEAREHE
jgi:PAS domain S-box-containing protein